MSDIERANILAKGYIDGDYLNEPYGLVSAILSAFHEKGIREGPCESMRDFLSRMDDSTLYESIVIVRRDPDNRVRTIEERFLNPASPQRCVDPEIYNAIVEWAKNNPLLVNRQNALVSIVNTTHSVPEFKLAINEMFVFVGVLPAFEPPMPTVLRDYTNEPYGVFARLINTLNDMGSTYNVEEGTRDFLSKLDDSTLHGVILSVQKQKKARTIEERFLDPQSPQRYKNPVSYQQVVEWVKCSPIRVKRLNALVHTLNTTENVLEFKIALNKMFELTGQEKDSVFKVSESSPKDPVRRAHPGFPGGPEI